MHTVAFFVRACTHGFLTALFRDVEQEVNGLFRVGRLSHRAAI